jgi:serine O-acetyltransferase
MFLDQATSLVVGETTVVEDDVSLLQNVTLGGIGKVAGNRHPKIRKGAVIGAGAKIAAGTAPPHSTVAGVPAKILKIEEAAAVAQGVDVVAGTVLSDSFVFSI